ncbi:MAG: alginate export family protein, partial [Bacillota bacterium]
MGTAGLGQAAEAEAPKAPAAKSEQAAVQPPVAAEKDWVDQVKQPAPWFKWGADERVRQEYIQNPFFFDTDPPGHEWNFLRLRSRVWGTLSPAEQIDINARLTWESRYWFTPESRPEPASGNDGPWDWSDVVWDNLNFKVKGVAGEKSSLTVGRQDIILGDGWLVLDGTPLDGSRTIYFDAMRLSLPFEEAKTAVDAIAIQQYSDPDEWLPPIGSRDYPRLTEQDETGAVLWVTNKSIKDTELNGYFIYKHDDAQVANGDNGDIYTLGTRAVHAFNQHWSAQAEGAYQFGSRENPALFGSDETDLSAFGVNSRLTYSFNDEWKNRLGFAFEYLSGDDP